MLYIKIKAFDPLSRILGENPLPPTPNSGGRKPFVPFPQFWGEKTFAPYPQFWGENIIQSPPELGDLGGLSLPVKVPQNWGI